MQVSPFVCLDSGGPARFIDIPGWRGISLVSALHAPCRKALIVMLRRLSGQDAQGSRRFEDSSPVKPKRGLTSQTASGMGLINALPSRRSNLQNSLHMLGKTRI